MSYYTLSNSARFLESEPIREKESHALLMLQRTLIFIAQELYGKHKPLGERKSNISEHYFHWNNFNSNKTKK